MRKTYKFKLYQNKKNKTLIRRIEIANHARNYILRMQRTYYKLFGKYCHKFELQKRLSKLKKTKFPFWNELGSQALSDVVDRLDFGYQKFFRKENKRPPKFRSRHNAKSFTLRQTAGWKDLGGNRIKIGKKIFKYHKSREIEGEVKTLTIKRNALGELFILFSCVDDEKISDKQGRTSVGIDFGLKTFLTISDGAEIHAEQFFRKSLAQLQQANKNLSRKKKGSNNRKRARISLARVYEKISNQRKDFHWKLAHQLTDSYDAIFIEDLNMDAMKRLWGRKISDLGFHQFTQILLYLCRQKSTTLRKVKRTFPSSKTCFECGHVNKDLELSDRIWTCPNCSEVLDRDLNAARNIFKEGVASFGLGDVRPIKLAIAA